MAAHQRGSCSRRSRGSCLPCPLSRRPWRAIGRRREHPRALGARAPPPQLARSHRDLVEPEVQRAPALRAIRRHASPVRRGRRRDVLADPGRARGPRVHDGGRPGVHAAPCAHARRVARGSSERRLGARNRRTRARSAWRSTIRTTRRVFLSDAMVRELVEQVEAGTWWRDDVGQVFRPTFVGAWLGTWGQLPPFVTVRRVRMRRRAAAILKELGLDGGDAHPIPSLGARDSFAWPAFVLAAVLLFYIGGPMVTSCPRWPSVDRVVVPAEFAVHNSSIEGSFCFAPSSTSVSGTSSIASPCSRVLTRTRSCDSWARTAPTTASAGQHRRVAACARA